MLILENDIKFCVFVSDITLHHGASFVLYVLGLFLCFWSRKACFNNGRLRVPRRGHWLSGGHGYVLVMINVPWER